MMFRMGCCALMECSTLRVGPAACMVRFLCRVLCRVLCSPCVAMDGEQRSTRSSRSGFHAGSNTPLHRSLVLYSLLWLHLVSFVLLAGGEQGSTPPLLRWCFIGGYGVGVNAGRVGWRLVLGATPLTIVACYC